MEYTITLYKFKLHDTGQLIFYWKVEAGKDVKYFHELENAQKYVRLLNP